MALCTDHYVDYVERRVDRFLKRYGLVGPDERVVVAVSGGKDSVALASILARLFGDKARSRLALLYIDLGIPGYSSKLRRSVEELAQLLGLPLIVIPLSEVLGVKSIHELARKAGRATCSVCGLVKRYIMNVVAVEANAVLATGHTLDDTLAYVIKDFMYQDEERLVKWVPRTPKAPGAAPKIRPVMELSERETLLYTVVKGLPFVHEECPFRPEDSIEDATKDYLNRVEEKHPGTKISFLRRLVSRLEKASTHLAGSTRVCRLCGMISQTDVCSFCKLTQKVLGEPKGPYVREYVRRKLRQVGW
jgi:uncharacterized protein (TIGR00269 family)